VEYDRENRAWWNQARDLTAKYARTLFQWSPDFERQWRDMGKYSSESEFIYWLVPRIYFKTEGSS
jgi:cyclopropane fatty-acyl-phospholipid synthase-like methyltransferase